MKKQRKLKLVLLTFCLGLSWLTINDVEATQTDDINQTNDITETNNTSEVSESTVIDTDTEKNDRTESTTSNDLAGKHESEKLKSPGISPRLSTAWPDVPNWARIDIARMLWTNGDKIIARMQADINSTTQRLGWEKDSTLTIDIPDREVNEEGPDGNTGIKGIVELVQDELKFRNDDTIKIGMTDGNKKLVIKRLKNKITDGQTTIYKTGTFMRDEPTNTQFYYNPWKLYVDGVVSNEDITEKPFDISHVLETPSISFMTSTPEVVNVGDKIPDPSSYINISNSLTGNPTFSYIKKPDFSQAGETEAVILIKDVLDDYHITAEATIRYTVKDERPLTAEVKPKNVFLGTNLTTLKVSDMIKEVKLGDKVVDATEYDAVIKKMPTADVVGDKKATIELKRKSNQVTSTVEVPITVQWANSLKLNGENLQTVMALTSHPKANNKVTLIATRGQIDNQQNTIHSTLTGNYLTISLNHSQAGYLNDFSPFYETQLKGTDAIETAFQSFGSQEMTVGDIIKVTHAEVLNNAKYIDRYTDNQLRSLSQPIHEGSYFELVRDGEFKELFINQLTVNKTKLPMYTTTDYLDKHIADYLDLQGHNIKIKGFSTYPKTNKAGETTGKIDVEETLTSGQTVQWSYEVPFEIEEGHLSLAVPDTFEFKETTISNKEQLVQRAKNSKLGLVISDDRGSGKQGGWYLTAQVKANDKGLASYLIFQKGTQEPSYLTSVTKVFSKAIEGDATQPFKSDVTSDWQDNDGVLLKIPAKNKLLGNKTYQETIYWNLVEGP